LGHESGVDRKIAMGRDLNNNNEENTNIRGQIYKEKKETGKQHPAEKRQWSHGQKKMFILHFKPATGTLKTDSPV